MSETKPEVNLPEEIDELVLIELLIERRARRLAGETLARYLNALAIQSMLERAEHLPKDA